MRLLEQNPSGKIGRGSGEGQGQNLAFQLGEGSNFRFRIEGHDGAVENARDIDHRLAVQSRFDDFTARIDDFEVFGQQCLSGCRRRDISDVNVQPVFGEETFVCRDPNRSESAAKRGKICTQRGDVGRPAMERRGKNQTKRAQP